MSDYNYGYDWETHCAVQASHYIPKLEEELQQLKAKHADLIEAVGNWLHNDDTFHPADAEWRARDKRLIKQMRKAYEALTNGGNCLSQAHAYIQELEVKHKALAGRHAALVEAARWLSNAYDNDPPHNDGYDEFVISEEMVRCVSEIVDRYKALTNGGGVRTGLNDGPYLEGCMDCGQTRGKCKCRGITQADRRTDLAHVKREREAARDAANAVSLACAQASKIPKDTPPSKPDNMPTYSTTNPVGLTVYEAGPCTCIACEKGYLVRFGQAISCSECGQIYMAEGFNYAR